jgi:hypothetical protein
MKWGKRKGPKKKLTKTQQAKRNRKIAVATTVAGYLAVASLLSASSVPVKSEAVKVAQHNAKIQDFIVKNGRTIIDIPAGALDLYRG